MDAKLADDDIEFGHKAFYWPKSWPKYEMTQKKRLTFTLTEGYQVDMLTETRKLPGETQDTPTLFDTQKSHVCPDSGPFD